MNFDKVRELKNQGREDDAASLAQTLAAAQADDAMLQYNVACLFDSLGREAEAVEYYVKAIDAPASELSAEDRQGAYLGLGSTYRTLGQYELSLRTLDRGRVEFPKANDLRVFRAMALYNLSRAKEAVSELLVVLSETSSDTDVRMYERALRLYAADLDRIW